MLPGRISRTENLCTVNGKFNLWFDSLHQHIWTSKTLISSWKKRQEQTLWIWCRDREGIREGEFLINFSVICSHWFTLTRRPAAFQMPTILSVCLQHLHSNDDGTVVETSGSMLDLNATRCEKHICTDLFWYQLFQYSVFPIKYSIISAFNQPDRNLTAWPEERISRLQPQTWPQVQLEHHMGWQPPPTCLSWKCWKCGLNYIILFLNKLNCSTRWEIVTKQGEQLSSKTKAVASFNVLRNGRGGAIRQRPGAMHIDMQKTVRERKREQKECVHILQSFNSTGKVGYWH